MKRIIALTLTLVLLAAFLPVGTVTHGAEAEKLGFYTVNFGGIEPFSNVYALSFFWGKVNKDNECEVSVYGASDIPTIAQKTKEDMNNRPDGARYFYFSAMTDVFKNTVKDAIDMTEGVRLVKDWWVEFLTEYKRIGGKLDGVALDLEYLLGSSFYIEDKHYGSAAADSKKNKNIYNEIVANPVYQTRIRPRLVELGFEFWPADKIGGDKSEIWSMYRYSGDYYAKDRSIWDKVYWELITSYIDEAVTDPLLEAYPNAVVSDYHRADQKVWQKGVDDHGGRTSGIKAGNASCYNLYDCRPNSNVFKYKTSNGVKRRTSYAQPPAFNDAVFEDKPFTYALYDLHLHKRMLEATDTGIINTHLSFFNYGNANEAGYSNTPYYSEIVYHVGMLNPQPFFGYIVKSEVEKKGENHPNPDAGELEYSLKIVNDLMVELTRVAGYADRKPIMLPYSWNGSFLLTGMYAGGRNIWRITPDTAIVSKENFKVAGSDPTFSIDGQTITFPGGKIIADNKVTEVGTCGYWVETAADVTPIVTSTADRYKNNPAFKEDFEGYKVGAFTTETAYPHTYWTVSGTAAIQKHNGSNAVSLTGTTSLSNTNIAQYVTAGDNIAKQQAWEITFTLPEGDYGQLQLLRYYDSDGGLKVEKGKVYYDEKGSYKELEGVTLSAGTYHFKREVDFRKDGAFTSSYYLYDNAGKLLGEVKNVPMVTFGLTGRNIFNYIKGATAPVLLDNYKIYQMGLTTDFELYDADSGKKLTATNAEQTTDTAYRLSWMNATERNKVAKIIETKSGKVLETVQMAPGMDGVVTGVVEANGTVLVSLEVVDSAPSAPDETPDDPATDPTVGTDDPQNPTEGTGETTAPENTGKPGNTPTEPGEEKQGLGGGMIALIILLAVAVLGGGGFAAYWYIIKPKKAIKPTEE